MLPDTRRRSALAAQFAGARANPGPAAVAIVTGLINGATMVAAASAIGWSTDHLVVPALSGGPVPARAWWISALLILGISAARWSTIFIRGLATGRVQYRAQAETRRAVVRRYLALDLNWHRSHSPGRLLAHAVSDVDALWSPMQFAYFAVGMVFMLQLALTELFRREAVLGLVGLALVALVLTLNVTYQRLLAPRAREAQEARGVVGGVAHESIEGGPVVRSLGLTAVEDARLAPGVERLRTADLRMAAVSSVFDPMLELLPTAAVLVVLAVAAPRVEQGSLSAPRLTSDVDQVTTFLQGGGIQFVTNAAQLVIATVIMCAYSWQLALPVLVLSGLLIAAMTLMQRVIARRYDRARRDLSRLQTAVVESVTGAPLIRATGIEERTGAKLDGAVDRARDSLLRTLVPLHGNTSIGEITISTMTVTVLLGGVWWALAGDPAEPRLTFGQVVAMVFLVTFFVRPLQFLVQSLGEAQNALTGWRRALELVITPSAEGRGGIPLPAGSIGVRVEHVSARYGDGPLVLHDVTVHIAPGEHVAVVGRTGSGKSTFAKLLTRRLEPAAGTIRLGGVPLDRLASPAGRVVILPQDPFLFDGTLGHNVRLGSAGATDADVLRILGALGLRDWLATLPQGLDTPVGLRGERLSAGERQLVGLARTALADPDLVVFDEATSGIDPATDVAVQRALAVLTRDRTTISIAHRMVTAETADRVLVFADGRVVQDGPHHRLAGEPGPYAGLMRAWSRP